MLFFAFIISADQYYVAESGNDGNDGSPGSPWATIGKAVGSGSPAKAGDQITVRTGAYSAAQINFGKSGAAGNPITLKAEANVVVNSTGQNGFNISQQHDWIIDGFRLNTVPHWGIAVWGCTNIIIRNCYIYKAGASAIIAIVSNFGTNDMYPVPQLWNIKVLNNTLDQANWSSGDNEGISIWATDGFEVAGNRLINCQREGIDIKTGSRNGSVHHNMIIGQLNKWSGTGMGVYIDGWHYETFNIDVYSNLIQESEEGFEINCEDCAKGDASAGVHDVRIFNNIVWGSKDLTQQSWKGRCMSLYNFPSGRVSRIHVFNNTFAGAGVAGIWIENANLQDMFVRNNIIVNNNGNDVNIVSGSGIIVENNILSTQPRNAAGATVRNNTIASPQFADSGAHDYHLKSTSPAVDAAYGTDVAAFDYDSTARPQGMSADIGAFEYTNASVNFPRERPGAAAALSSRGCSIVICDIAGRTMRKFEAGDAAGGLPARWLRDLAKGVYIISTNRYAAAGYAAMRITLSSPPARRPGLCRQ